MHIGDRRRSILIPNLHQKNAGPNPLQMLAKIKNQLKSSKSNKDEYEEMINMKKKKHSLLLKRSALIMKKSQLDYEHIIADQQPEESKMEHNRRDYTHKINESRKSVLFNQSSIMGIKELEGSRHSIKYQNSKNSLRRLSELERNPEKSHETPNINFQNASEHESQFKAVESHNYIQYPQDSQSPDLLRLSNENTLKKSSNASKKFAIGVKAIKQANNFKSSLLGSITNALENVSQSGNDMKSLKIHIKRTITTKKKRNSIDSQEMIFSINNNRGNEQKKYQLANETQNNIQEDWSQTSDVQNEGQFAVNFNVSFPLEFYRKSDKFINTKIDIDSLSPKNMKQSQGGSQLSNPSTDRQKKKKPHNNLLLSVSNEFQFRVTAKHNMDYINSNLSQSEKISSSKLISQEQKSSQGEFGQTSWRNRVDDEDDEQEYIDEYYDADPDQLQDIEEINGGTELDEVEEMESGDEDMSLESQSGSESDSDMYTGVQASDFVEDYNLLAEQDPYNDFYPLIMIQNHNFSWIRKECTSYQDNYPLLFIRKVLFVFIEILYVISHKLISSKYWVFYTLSVSIASIVLFLNQRYKLESESNLISDQVIIALFAFEEFVKIMGHGIKRYVSNLWNFYDLLILILYTFYHYDPHLIPVNVSPFRIIRIPFYLGDFSHGLNESFKALMETFLVLLIFTGFFTLITLHLFNGLLRYQCFDTEVGIFHQPLHVCGFQTCHEGLMCLKNTINPEYAENWDDFLFAYINIIKTATMIDMHFSMIELMNAFHPSVFILFLSIIFIIGLNYLLIKIQITLLKTQYRESTEIFESNQFHEKQQEKSVRLNVRILMDLNLYQELKQLKNGVKQISTQSAEITNKETTQVKQKEVKKVEEKEKKTATEIKLLSARQQNMIENYKKRMQMLYENTSWVNSWLFPDQKIKQKMTQLISDQENFFLQYYDLQIYYRFRSTDFLSLSLYLKPEKDLIYSSTSEKQVLEKKDFREKKQLEKLLRLKSLAFKYKLEDTQEDFKRVFKPSKVRLPLLDRELRNLPQYAYTVTPPPDVEIQVPQKILFQKQSSPFSFNGNEYKADEVIACNTKNYKSFKQFASFKNIQMEKLFEKRNESENISMDNHEELSESVLEESKIPEIKVTEKKNNFSINGEEKFYEDLVEMIAQPIEQEEEKKNISDYQEKYEKIRYYDMQNGMIDGRNWSGGTVLQYSGYANRLEIIIQAINSKEYKMMSNFFLLATYRVHKLLVHISQLKFISVFYDVCLVINTILVSLVGLIDQIYINSFSDTLNYILTWELLVKFIADKKSAQQVPFILQSAIIIICDTSMVIKQYVHRSETTKIDQYYDWIEMLKVLLFIRLFKYNKMARKLYQIAQMTYREYMYLAILMFFLILNISVVGIQVFGDEFPHHSERGQLFSFADIQKSWFAVFVLMTMDDWFALMVMSQEHHLSKIASIGFCLFLIFVLNYLMKELLMAMILEGFGEKLFEKNKDNFEKGDNNSEDQDALEDEQNKSREDVLEDLLAIMPIETTEEIQQNVEEIEKQNLKLQNPNQYAINYFRKVETRKKKRFFRVANILDKLTAQQRELQIYEDLECKQSFFHFDKKHPFRKFSYNLLQKRYIQQISQIILTISIVNMIAITYHKHGQQNKYTDLTVQVTLLTNIFIFCESLIRMVAYGVIADEDSLFTDYLRGIDFIYCFFSLIKQFYSPPQIEFLNILGYIRPLRVLSIFETFKLEKIALFQSITQIWQIAFLLLSFWYIFGIFGVWLFQGKMNFCEELMEFHVNEEECISEGKHWRTGEANFENILQAMSSLFQLASFDYMGEILVGCINGTEHGPIQYANEIVSYIFFIPFLFFGGHFFLGIFAAVIYMNFKLCKETFVYGDLTQDQINFLKISEIILQEDPSYSDPPRSWFRVMTQQIISNKFYHGFIILILAANIIILALFYQDQSYDYAITLNCLHHVCSLIFLVDALLKLTTYQVIRYLGHFWRLIELGLCLLSFLDFLMDITYQWFEFYLTADISDPMFRPVRILFILRDLRVLLIIQEFIGIQRLLHVITFSLGSLMKILCFYILVIFVYAFLGCQLFGEINKGKILTDQLNFSNFFNAVITLYKVTTKNHWRLIYMDSTHMNPYCEEDHTQCGQSTLISALFYFSFLVLSNYILLNIFILTLVDNFDSFFSSTSSIIETYIENLDKFRNVWCKYSYEKKGKKMHTKYLAHFLLQLGEPLGCQSGDNVWDVAKNASNFKIKCDLNGYVHFNELLYESVKYGFKERLFKGGTYEGFRQLKMHDKKIRYRLHQMRDQGQRRAVLNHIVKLRGNFNILQEYLYVLMAIKTWKSYTSQFIEDANLTDSQDFTENTEVQSSNNSISLEKSEISENIDSPQKQQISPVSNDGSFKDIEDIPFYEQKPDHIFKISFLNRIYQQKFKDKVILSPSRI